MNIIKKLKTFFFHLIFFIRSFLGTIGFVFLTLFCSLSTLFILLWTTDGQKANPIVTLWAKGTLFLFGVRIKAISSLRELPKGSFLMLFNHTSFLDIFAISSIHPEIRFGAKKELFSIPVFGAAMKRSGILPIDRSRREQTFRVYDQALSRVEHGHRFALSPEGGRGDGSKIFPFKAGPFVFAIRAQIPVVSVWISGSNRIWPKGSWLPNTNQWTSTIELTYMSCQKTKGLSIEDRSQFQRKCYEIYSHKMNTLNEHIK